MLYRKTFSRLAKLGSLTVITPKGESWQLGDGTKPEVTIRMTTKGAMRRLMTHPTLAMGELYMSGGLVIEKGTLAELVQLAARKLEKLNAAQGKIVK
ncbi:MAG: hypothetical protein ORN98_07185 [Alphaproteobacteria bacterium]|nr:hypothetical protein [Alphaproteobacteria bacterium]